MKNNHTAIHRAAKSLPTCPLPANFHTRMAARLQKERRREQRIELFTNIACCAVALVLLIVAIVWAAERLEISWKFPMLKKFEWQRLKQFGCIPLAISALLILNSYIEARLQLRRLKKELSKQRAE